MEGRTGNQTGQKDEPKTMPTNRFQKVEQILRGRREELMARLERREEIQIEHAPDALDAVQNLMQREFAVDQIDRDSRLLRQIEEALARISEGTYGTCSHCEEEISAKRLAAIPWAALCIGCQSRADLERGSVRSEGFAPLEFAAAA